MHFDDRTIERGIDYHDGGHVVRIHGAGDRVVGEVSGTRPRPYVVVLDTEHPNSSVCSCPVGYACKHLVALVLAAVGSDRLNRRLRDRARAFAVRSGLMEPEPDVQREQTGGGFVLDLAAEVERVGAESDGVSSVGAAAGGAGPTGPDAVRVGRPRFVTREDEVGWRAALLVARDFTDQPTVYVARQYRRRDGRHGRIDAIRPDEPLSVPDERELELLERLRVLGHAVPVLAFADELVDTSLPIFEGTPDRTAGAHERPVRVVRAERYEIDITPGAGAAAPGDDGGSLRLSLHATLRVPHADGCLTIPPYAFGEFDEGAGLAVASFPEAGVVLVDAEASVLPQLRRWTGAYGRITPRTLAELRSLADSNRERLAVRFPARIRLEETVARPIFVVGVLGDSVAVRLELEEDAQEDGYAGDEYVVHQARRDPPTEAIDAASRIIGARPVEPGNAWMYDYDDGIGEESGPWLWVAPAGSGVAHAIELARALCDLDVPVYVSGPRGRRRVRRARRLSVHVRSGTDWFAPVVREGELPPLDAQQLRELAMRGTLSDGEELVLFSREEADRIARLLEITADEPDARMPRADIASLAELADIADEIAPDLEPVRDLALDLLSGRRPRAPRKPAGLTAKLRPYQRDGFAWLANLARHGLSGCLADDMGLGKTVQALALMLHLAGEDRGVGSSPDAPPPPADDPDLLDGGFLVVAPVSTLGNWVREASRFAPSLTALTHHGAARGQDPASLAAADLVVTSYATARRDAELFAAVRWRLAVLDEAQAIKNPHARTAKAVKSLSSRLRLCLTGTPVENVSTDLYSIMDFLVPGLLGTLAGFSRRFPKRNVAATDEAASRLARLRRIVAPFLLRRTKEAVAPELPPRIETVLSCEMGAKQARFYETLRSYHHDRVRAAIDRGDIREIGAAIFTGLLRLRQAAIYPPAADPTGEAVPSVKEAELLDRLDEIVGEDHRAIVFSQFVSALSAFRDRAERHGIVTLYLDGKTRDRDTLIDEFQGSERPVVFFISLKAGGTGINLTAADHVFVCDPWWNPQVERQAVDRAHRIGRERPVVVTRLVTAGTVEEKVLELQDQKRVLAADLIAENAGGIDLAAADELLALFEKG
ncbi:MAG: SNF2-related protein [Spirochaetota bacterium]